MLTDRELILRYVEHGDASAFAGLVGRHVHWVNSMAGRIVGDRALAEDVTQAVFVLLARKARSLRRQTLVSTWLFTVTRYCASSTLRNERRRRAREREAGMLRVITAESDQAARWDELVPLLDVLVGRLRRSDREAVLLRFYERKSFGEIGQSLKVSEEAARKRVMRAVEQLRGMFARRGVVVPAGALGVMMSQQMTQTASAGVIASATAAAQGGAAAGAVSSLVQLANAWLIWMGLKPVAMWVVGMMFLAAMTAAVMQVTGPVAAQAPPALVTSGPTTRSGPLGLILTPDDRPMAGARVHLVEYENYGPARTVDSTTTDSAGLFSFAPRENPLGKLRSMLVQTPGYGLTITTLGGDGEEPRETMLRPATSVRVRFVGPDGVAVQGLRVFVERIQEKRLGNSGQLSEQLRAQFTQITDEQGECVFAGLPQDSRVVLDVAGEKYSHLTYEQGIVTNESATTLAPVIRLQLAGTISGRVFYQHNGQPLAGVRLNASPSDRAGSGGGWAFTDAQGNYRITRLLPAEYGVGVRLSQEILSQYATPMRMNIRAIAGIDIPEQDFALIPGAVIQGKLIVKSTGRPLADMSVGVYSPRTQYNQGWLSSVVTGADGSYLLHVPPGTQHLYIGQTTPVGLLDPEPKSYDLSLEDGQIRTIDFEFPPDPAPPVHGIVVDAEGKPVAGASVELALPGDRLPFPRGYARTGIDGRFSFAAAPAGSMLRASRGRWISTEPINVTDGQRELRIVLRKDALASVLVRVRLPDGSPAIGAKVDLVEWEGQLGLGSESKRTGQDGNVVFRHLLPTKKLQFSAGGEGFNSAAGSRMAVESGKQSEITLVVHRADSFVGGMVVDLTGQPIPDIEVRVTGALSSGQTTRTDLTGRFIFQNLVAGDQITLYTRAGSVLGPRVHVLAGRGDAVLVYNPVEAPQQP